MLEIFFTGKLLYVILTILDEGIAQEDNCSSNFLSAGKV
jgi:hypothetical protein